MLPRLDTSAPRGRRAPETPLQRGKPAETPLEPPSRRGSKALFSAYRSRLSLGSPPPHRAAYLQPPFCPWARSYRSGSRHTQVCSTAPQSRQPSCCPGATTHARPAPWQADSESTCRVLTAAPGGKDPRPRAEVELQVLGEARGRGGEVEGNCATLSLLPKATQDTSSAKPKDDHLHHLSELTSASRTWSWIGITWRGCWTTDPTLKSSDSSRSRWGPTICMSNIFSGETGAANSDTTCELLIKRKDEDIYIHTHIYMGFLGGSESKESSCNPGDLGSIPGLERSPGGGYGNPFQYSYLENPHGQGASWAVGSQRVGHHWATKQSTAPCPPPGDLADPGIKTASPASPALQDSIPTEPPGSCVYMYKFM